MQALSIKPGLWEALGPRVWAISSGKGGVGKTNFAANLAVALSLEGYRVLIFDADLGLANVDVLLGLSPKENIANVFLGKCKLKDVIIEGPQGVKILPASSGTVDLTNLTNVEKLRLLDEFESLESELDFVLLDTAAGISENVLYFNLAAQERILLLTPEPTSITDVYALIKVLYKKYQIKKFHLVINCVKNEGQAKNVFRQLMAVTDQFLGSISLNLMGVLPYDVRVRKSVREQRPFVELFPQAKVSKAIRDIAKKVILSKQNPMDGGLKFFGRKLMGVVS